MRQEDAVHCRTRWSIGSAREVCELPSEIRSCVDHPTFITARIDDSHACNHARFRRVIPARIIEATRLRYAAILSDAENHDRWSAENSRVGCSASRIASHEKDSDGCDDLACVHRASLYLYSPCLFNAVDECRGISWRRVRWANGATRENYSAAKAKAANAPHCRQTFAVHHRGDTFNSWNRSFVVDLSGARPRHCKCEVLSMAVS